MEAQRIGGATRLLALLGWPVAHSLSPLIHNHALRRSGLDLVYVPLAVAPADLHAAVAGLRACGFAGANVTIPHKQAVLHCCDRLAPLSARVGAVNTLYFEDGLLCGTTTDPEGFLRALAWMGHDPADGRVVILGNGGTARTLAMALALQRLPRLLTVVGRAPSRAQRLADEVSAASGTAVAHAGLQQAGLAGVVRDCTLLVNCTSAGMPPQAGVSPLPPGLLHKGVTVFDTVYSPAETQLLAQARAAGCRSQNGLRMLLYQGLASLKLWTGVDVDESMFDLEQLQAAVSGRMPKDG